MNRIIFSFLVLLSIYGCNKDPLLPVNENKANHITAKYAMTGIENVVKKYDKEKYSLMTIRSNNVDYRGYSDSWKYEYLRKSDDIKFTKNLYLSSYFSFIKLDSALTKKNIFGGSEITQKWVDSDKALEIAELHGGSKFRSENPNYTISALLNQGLIIKYYTRWIIVYCSKKNPAITKTITVDAVDGTVNE